MKTAVLLKGIAVCHKQLVVGLSDLHPQLDRQTLNQTAQDVISQCITLHICHDRGIQPHFHQTQPDCSIDAELLQSVSQQLSALKQSCQISVLPIELLGQIHEQFWAMHRSTTRKAQGVYYTPVAIVDYLINSTVGVLLQNKTVEDLIYSQLPLRILDPACGSGAFLLRAYQYLLRWYFTQYLAAIDRYKTQLYQFPDGEWHLTIAAKQKILLQHIYGLDINQNAVGITSRSLLLQMLENTVADNQVPQPNYRFDSEVLQHNLQCGNALIDLDFYLLNPQTQFTPIEVSQINAFSWKNAFPDVMRSGGFEIIIGNPPWIFTRNAQFTDPIKRYYRIKYLSQQASQHQLIRRSKAKQTGKVNLFVLFLFKCIELMHQNGRVGIVVPNTLLRTTVYETVRKHILDRCSLEQIVDLGHQAFSGVTAASTALILGKNLEKPIVEFVNSIDKQDIPKTIEKCVFLNNTSYVFSVLLNESQGQLFQKISSLSIALSNVTSEIMEGIVCRKDQIKRQVESDRDQKILEGKDIERYCISFREKYILFDRKQLHRPRPDRVWNAQEKIILRRIGGGKFALVAALDTDHYYAFASTNNILLSRDHRYNIRYILALLNSRLLNCYYIQNFTNQSSLTVNIAKTFLEQLPIRSINFDCPAEKLQHDRLVDQVDYLQMLHRQRCAAHSAREQQNLQQQIQKSDRFIDQWVYELYNLTETEIELVQREFDGVK